MTETLYSSTVLLSFCWAWLIQSMKCEGGGKVDSTALRGVSESLVRYMHLPDAEKEWFVF